MISIDRSKIIDKNFIKFLSNEKLPKSKIDSLYISEDIPKDDLIGIFESQVLSRHIDLSARKYKEKGICHYTISSSGHEGNAVFGNIFPLSDMAFLHYRSGAFFLERSKKLPGSTPIFDTALSLVASKDDPISSGRHKVFGSKELNIPPQTSTIASHLPKAVGFAFSIDRGRDLKLKENVVNNDSVVLCSFGDAGINHATALSGINTASYISYMGGNVPIIFMCEDNELGISVPTPDLWIEHNYQNKKNLKYIQSDGRNLLEMIVKVKEAEAYCRKKRSPVFFHMKTVRLMGHAGSDIETVYRSKNEIEKSEFDDPLLHSARIIIEKQLLSKDDILKLYEVNRKKVDCVFESASFRPKLKSKEEIMSSILPNKNDRTLPNPPSDQTRKTLFNKDFDRLELKHSMSKLLNYCLVDILAQYPNTVIFGEDVSRKGGVYGVTAGLVKKFGYKRVFDSPLDETSIIGFGIGFGMNGYVPIIEIQFLAYFHNAEDQLRGEASTLSFFSNRKFSNPMIIRVPGLAYQKGFGGHFHNDNSLSIFKDIPGIIVAVPSNGEDAVKMMRTAVKEAFLNQRIIIFIEPIALYNQKDLYEKKDNLWTKSYPKINENITVGEFGLFGSGNELTIISYGNGFYLSMKAKRKIEEKINKKIKIIDLRWLTDINYSRLIKEIEQSKKILIVDECRKSGCFGESIFNNISSSINGIIKLHSAEDCFITIGESSTYTLPSVKSIAKEALDLINA